VGGVGGGGCAATFQVLAWELRTVRITSPSVKRVRATTHGSGLATPEESAQFATRALSRSIVIDAKGGPGGISDESMRNLRVRGCIAVAVGAVISNCNPYTETPGGAEVEEGSVTRSAVPPEGRVMAVVTEAGPGPPPAGSVVTVPPAPTEPEVVVVCGLVVTVHRPELASPPVPAP